MVHQLPGLKYEGLLHSVLDGSVQSTHGCFTTADPWEKPGTPKFGIGGLIPSYFLVYRRGRPRDGRQPAQAHTASWW